MPAITIRFSESELSMLRSKAGKAELNVSDYVKFKILDLKPPITEHKILTINLILQRFRDLQTGERSNIPALFQKEWGNFTNNTTMVCRNFKNLSLNRDSEVYQTVKFIGKTRDGALYERK